MRKRFGSGLTLLAIVAGGVLVLLLFVGLIPVFLEQGGLGLDPKPYRGLQLDTLEQTPHCSWGEVFKSRGEQAVEITFGPGGVNEGTFYIDGIPYWIKVERAHGPTLFGNWGVDAVRIGNDEESVVLELGERSSDLPCYSAFSLRLGYQGDDVEGNHNFIAYISQTWFPKEKE